ncbi:MAG: hypothetical protein ACYDGO_11755 [Smithellaceae bacterium]
MNLSLYSPKQEEDIYIRRQAQTWQRSGLISEGQMQAFFGETDPNLHQTNLFFRVLFFIFTLLCAGAVAGLFVWLMERAGDKILAMVVLLFGIVYFILAEHLVKIRRLYRYGIEEALLMAGMVCFVVSFLMWIDNHHLNHRTISIAVCLLFSVISCLIYLRFGYLYAALISAASLSAVPFQLFALPETERLLLLCVLTGIFVFCLVLDKPGVEDFRKDRYTKIQVCLLAAIYVTVNLHILGLIGLLFDETRILHFYPKAFPPWYYWLSYVLTFMIPVAVIYWGIKIHGRFIINAGLVMAIATLATNKSYLGLTRYAWDPAILGVVMIGLSLGMIRWLNSGPDKKRSGFTAYDILKPEDNGINLGDVAAALTPGAIDAGQPQTSQDNYFQGGKSGGGGASRHF